MLQSANSQVLLLLDVEDIQVLLLLDVEDSQVLLDGDERKRLTVY